MSLEIEIADYPAELLIGRLIDFHLEQAAAHGFGEALRKRLMGLVDGELSDGVHDLIEPVATVAPRTGHLIVGFRIGDGFNRAIASSAQNGLGLFTH